MCDFNEPTNKQTMYQNQTFCTSCAVICRRVPSLSDFTTASFDSSTRNDKCWACPNRCSISDSYTCKVLKLSDNDFFCHSHNISISSSLFQACHLETKSLLQVRPCSRYSQCISSSKLLSHFTQNFCSNEMLNSDFFRRSTKINIGHTLLLLMLVCLLWLPESGNGATISSSSSLHSISSTFSSSISSLSDALLPKLPKNSTLKTIEFLSEINRKLELKIEQLEIKFQKLMKENHRQQRKQGHVVQQLHNIQQRLSDKNDSFKLTKSEPVILMQRIFSDSSSSSTTIRPRAQSRQRLPGRFGSLLIHRSLKTPNLMVFYHQCSSGYVQPLPEKNRLVAVKPPRRSGLFQIKPLHHLHQNLFVFQTKNGRTLCLSKRGQPILKNLRNVDQCALEMLYLDGGIVQFRLASNKTTYLKFNELGKPVSGHMANEQNSKRDTCTHFVRRMENIVKFAAEPKPKFSKKRRALLQMQRELESTKQLLKESKAEFERHQQYLLADLKSQELYQQQVDKKLLNKLDNVEQQLLNQQSKQLPTTQVYKSDFLSLSSFASTSVAPNRSASSTSTSVIWEPVALTQSVSNPVFEQQSLPKFQVSNLKQPSLEEELQSWAIKNTAPNGSKSVASVKRKRHQSYLLSPRHKVTMTWPNDLDIN